MNAEKIYDLDKAREAFAKNLRFTVCAKTWGKNSLSDMVQTFQAYKNGKCPVVIDYEGSEALAKLRFGENWRVQPTEDLLCKLKNLNFVENVYLEY